MPESINVVPHPPALKVGGRRRSVSSKPKTQNTGGTQLTEPAGSDEATNNETAADDYPRPAPPSEGQQADHRDAHHQYQDEEQARKEKKHPSNEKMKEYAHWKAETTRPTRYVQGNVMKGWGASGRIAQPAGKMA